MKQGQWVDIDFDNMTEQEWDVWEKQRDAVLWIEQLTDRARQEAEALVFHDEGDIYAGFGVDYSPDFALEVGQDFARIDALIGKRREDAEAILASWRTAKITLTFIRNNEGAGEYVDEK